MGFLTRLLAGLTAAAALGTGLAGTANAVDTNGAAGTTKSVVKLTADDTNNLPDHIVNGSFDYPSVPSWTGLAGSSSNKFNKGKRFATINPGTGKYGSGCAMSTTGRAIPNWNRSSFAWSSTQGDTHYSGGMSCEAGNVELNYDSVHHNQFAELTADQQGTAIYQDVKVTPGTMMKWSLKHSSATSAYVDKMQVMIGEPYKETAQEATRITSENGNKVGEKMTTISTPTTSDRADNKKWDTYSGAYLVPDGVTTVRFTFKSVASAEWYSGNDLDDIEFSRSYKLTYDKNSSDAAGEVPSNQRGKENTVQPAKVKTTGTVKNVADTNASLPDHLVNGDFEYPGANVLSKNPYNWWGVSRKDKMVYYLSHETQWVPLPSTFDSDRFAWDSTEVAGVQNGSSQWHTNEVELQQDSRTGNMYAELCAYQAHTSIRQYIHTTPGTLYKVRLKHASLSRDYLDKMQVLVGPAGNEQPVRMTRVESQNGLDATGESTASTTISTHASNEMEIKDGQDGQGTPYSSRNHNGQWATYEGVYVATSDVTSFTFKSVDAKAYNLGNLLDDIVFDKAYRLSYDKNATDANGSVPSDETAGTVKQAKARATGALRLASDDDVAAYAASSLPDHLVNGDFSVNYHDQWKDSFGGWTSIDPNAGKTLHATSLPNGSSWKWTAINGWDVSDLVQRTTTHEDGSVTVKTIDQSTDVVSGCQVYYPAGQRITLATMAKDDDCWDASMLTRPGHTQLGWNQDRNATQAQAQVTMVEGGMTVYAVWVGNPVLTYDTNKPSTWSGQMPSTPASVSVPYNTNVSDESGWRAGDTTKIRGYRFLGWYTGPQDNAGLYDWTRPLTGNVTVYAHWQRLQANVIYDANGGTGSHPNTTGWQYSDATIPGDTSKSFKHDGLYRFKHWNTQPNDQGTVYTDGSRIALQDKDITLYAIWVPYHENFVPTGGIGLPIAIAGGVLLLMFGIGSTVMLTRRMNGHGMPDDE